MYKLNRFLFLPTKTVTMSPCANLRSRVSCSKRSISGLAYRLGSASAFVNEANSVDSTSEPMMVEEVEPGESGNGELAGASCRRKRGELRAAIVD